MRFTVKAKLASAFGVVITLSIVTGAIAYSKLTALDELQQRMVAQAERMRIASGLMNGIQGQVRAETRIILANSEKDAVDNHKVMLDRRDATLKLKDDLIGRASDAGKTMLEAAAVKLKQMNDLEEQTAKFALLRSADRAAEIWNAEGLPILREFNAASDAGSAEIGKIPASIESMRAEAALKNAKYQAARLARAATTSFGATSI